jgi:2',3'-cyclic-nucleotide 2'-phosphodiesterase (5'-nucleotidase family)
MRLSRRLATLTVAAALTITSLGLAGSAEARPRPSAKEIQLQVLSFNDYHGHLQPPGGSDATLGTQLDPRATPVGGAEYLASTLDRLRQKARYSHTVAAGDLIGGSPFLSGLFHDEPAVESLNALGLDVSGVGNHEFDEGVTELLRMQRGGCHPEDGCYEPWGEDGYPGADFPWLAANVVRTSTGRTILPGTAIRTVRGIKVGYIGMTLEATPTLVAQAGIRGIEFRDEVETANRAARELRRRGVQTIIVLLHEGGFQTGTYQQCVGISGPVVDIAQNLHPEIDLVVTGHTHQPYICNIPDPAGRKRMVTSASSFGRVVTETTLTIGTRTGEVNRRKTKATNHLVTRIEADPVQTEIISRWNAAAAPIANRVVGSLVANTDITRSPDRNTEGPLANLIADAQLAATSAPGDGGAQIAFMNPGGVRADLTFNQISGGEQPGEVTYGEAFAVQPFGNLLVTMDLTGAQIEQLLEQQAITGRPGGRDVLILGVSRGFTFSYDPAAPIGNRIDPASIQLNGTTVVPTATYRIVTNSFLADGGDSFTAFTQGTNRIGGGEDLVAFTEYLGENSPVAPPEDRIAGI